MSSQFQDARVSATKYQFDKKIRFMLENADVLSPDSFRSACAKLSVFLFSCFYAYFFALLSDQAMNESSNKIEEQMSLSGRLWIMTVGVFMPILLRGKDILSAYMLLRRGAEAPVGLGAHVAHFDDEHPAPVNNLGLGDQIAPGA